MVPAVREGLWGRQSRDKLRPLAAGPAALLGEGCNELGEAGDFFLELCYLGRSIGCCGHGLWGGDLDDFISHVGQFGEVATVRGGEDHTDVGGQAL